MKLSKLIAFSLLLLMAAFILISSCSSNEDLPVEYLENVEVSYITPSQAPAIDGTLEPIWQAANSTQLISEQGSDYNPSNKLALVNISALCDSNYIYISASWKDVTENNRFLQLVWTNQFGWNRPNVKEDNITFFFTPADESTTDADPNCFAMCHTADLIMKNETDRTVDGWYWRASLTDPMTRALDLWFADSLDADTSFLGVDAEVSPGYALNFLTDPITPIYWNSNYEVNATIVDDDTIRVLDNGAFIMDTDTLPYTTFPEGVDLDSVLVPSFIVFSNPEGSRWDVEAKGKWDEVSGRWTVEFKRLLNTGNEDDIEFVLDGEVRMVVAVGDKAKHPHIGYQPVILEF